VITYDRRGTGGSDRVQREFSVDQFFTTTRAPQFNRDLLAFLRAPTA